VFLLLIEILLVSHIPPLEISAVAFQQPFATKATIANNIFKQLSFADKKVVIVL